MGGGGEGGGEEERGIGEQRVGKKRRGWEGYHLLLDLPRHKEQDLKNKIIFIILKF